MSKKTPQIRFKGFTDDWEERKLGEFSDVRDGTHASPKYVSQGHPMVTSKNLTHSGLDMTDVSFLTDEDFNEINKRSKVSIGDILFGMIGTIGNPVIVDRDDFAIKNVALIKEKTSNPITNKWLLQYLKSPSFNRFIQKENAGGTQKFIALGLIRDMKLRVPEFDEQQKIGSFFKQLDNTIALHQRKLDLLKEQKKGFLQKMFPKNGAKVPELRFSGFADDWEERKLSSMTNYKNGKSHEDKQSTSGKLELINLNSISISGGLKHSGKFIDEADDTLQKDDLVMILSDVGHGDLLGRVALIPKDDRFVLNQRVALLRPNTTADPQFLFSYINAHQYYFKAQGAGMSQLNISKGSVENFISFVPIIEEQKKIGAFFKQIDDTIALHQRKLDLLKEQKKGFLQKMFVS